MAEKPSDSEAFDVDTKELMAFTVFISGTLLNLSRKQVQLLVVPANKNATGSISGKTNLPLLSDVLVKRTKLKQLEKLIGT